MLPQVQRGDRKPSAVRRHPVEAGGGAGLRPVFAADEAVVAEPVELGEHEGVVDLAGSGSFRPGVSAIWMWAMRSRSRA